jgi:hypothetical protein
MSQEKTVYLICLEPITVSDILEEKHFSDLTDDEFKAVASEQDGVYTLAQFVELYNDLEFESHSTAIRIL